MLTTLRTSCIAIAFLALVAGCSPQPGPAVTGSASGKLAAEPAGASSKDFGSHVVHFSALSTDHLRPEVAKTYNIVRSKNRALLNVSVLKKTEGTTGTPVTAEVTALVANDTGQVKDSTIREIREDGAVYYVADYAVSSGETLIFNIDAIPEGENAPLSLRFTQTFYGD